MAIEPRVEEPARDLLGRAIRGEWDDFANVAENIAEQRLLECLGLYLQIAGYIAIDISGHAWPTTADVRDIARRAAAAGLGFDLSEDDAHAYLARAALGFEPLAEVFPNRQKLASATIFTTAALLVSYRRHGTDWWDYLNTIETALETAAPLSEDVEPAVVLLSRKKRARRQ
jgi:predicted NBD/HSP70 family sugar kinase